MKITDLEKIDTRSMFKAYDKWPEIAIESFERKYKKFESKEIDHVVFAGMGGSGSLGDTISAILSKMLFVSIILEDYKQPQLVSKIHYKKIQKFMQ